jgi:uncharacterized protein
MADESVKKLTPSFVIKANGNRLSVDKEANVKQIIITETIDAPSIFAIYMSDMKKQWADNSDFFVGSEIKISLGYKDDLEELMSGEVTKIELEFEKNSDITFIIKGQNHIHRLKRSVKNRPFTDKEHKDIIKQMASDAGLSSDIGEVGLKSKFATQNNLTDFDYIMDLAQKYNCSVWAKDKKLYVKQPESGSDDLVLEWGKTLLSFHPVCDSENLATETEIIGWSHEKNEVIKGTAKVSSIKSKIGGENIGSKVVEDNFKAAKAIFKNNVVPDQKSADTLALDFITSNSMKYMTASGKCEGNKKLRAGMNVKINEVGSRFSGKYLVNTAKHVLTVNEGYSTYFEISRNATE